MATRFYFPLDEAGAVSPTISAEWEHQNAVRRRLLMTTPDASTLTTTAYNPDGSEHIADNDSHHRQYISDPLAAQNISGTVKAQVQCTETNAGNNLKLTLKIFVVDQAGTTIKETLLAITRQGTEPTTSLRNTSFPSIAISAADIEANDRIVVEIGLGGLSVASGGTQTHNGSMRWGGSASGGDLAENETEAGTTFRPWIEFSDTITVPSTPYSAELSAAAVAATPQTLTRLNDYLLQPTAAAIAVTAQAITRLNDYVASMSAAVVNFVGQAVNLPGAEPFVADLSAAAVAVTAQAIQRVNDWRAGLTAATLSVTAGAAIWTQDTVIGLGAAAIDMTGTVLTWLVGSIPPGLRVFLRRRR